jgi:fermentation-respiration switch protein FrsA (DUF1100 family)
VPAIAVLARASRWWWLPAVALLAGCIENAFFHPDRRLYHRPADFGLAAQDVHFTAADGSQLHGWWLPAAGPSRGTVIHAHGNAANVSNHLPLVAWLPPAGYNVFMFDYRGFGRSEGRPSLAGVVEDLQAARQVVAMRPGVDSRRVAVLGQSLGGATAVRAVARDGRGVRLLIIDAAFDSYRGVARDAAASSLLLRPLLPLALPALPPASEDPLADMAKVSVPVLILHGNDDTLIPPEHSARLYAAASGPKEFVRVPRAGHLDVLTRPEVQARVLQALHLAME